MVSIRRLQKFMMYDEVASPETKSVKENVKEKYKENANENYKQNLNENYKETANKNYKENVDKNYEENVKDEVANQKDSDQINADQPDYIEHCISIENGSAKWLDYEPEDTLQNINIKVRPGELIAVVGQVGVGKSSLMNVILKELRLHQGSIQVCEQFLFDAIILN